MKRLKDLDLYESILPPERTDVLWVKKDHNTGDIQVINKYNHTNGSWEPWLVSVDYMKPDEE